MGKNSVNLLDCTLRDGAYLIDKDFGRENIVGIIDGLIKANIDIVEIGFLQDEGQAEGKTVFFNSKDAKQYIPVRKQGQMFAVMADYSRYNVNNLDDNDGKSFDIVRECFFKHERYQALEVCKKIKEKGYKVFIQPVDILGYSDLELIELLNEVNKIEPYCISIVDTFGSMYLDDLDRVFSIIHHNLIDTISIGFHSHNNMQMSSALSQRFIELCGSKRNGIVDTTISGMGRGAGNTPTELVAEYMVRRLEKNYDIDAILSVIDTYMENIKARCTWGYSTDFFIAGSYSSHVNNVAYLRKKTSIASKDMRFILNKLSGEQRKRYDYDLLEKTYLEHLDIQIDDSDTLKKLKDELCHKHIVILAPGKNAIKQKERIKNYIKEKKAVVISINYVHDEISADYIYISNKNRYSMIKNRDKLCSVKKIMGANLEVDEVDEAYIISIDKFIKCGWIHFDNSIVILLRLLDVLNVKAIGIAGADGYNLNEEGNYYDKSFEKNSAYKDAIELNSEMISMLEDYKNTRKNREIPVEFITSSRYEKVFDTRTILYE